MSTTESNEKIQRAITRMKCGTAVKEACKAEGIAPPVLYQSPEYKAYKAETLPERVTPDDPVDEGTSEAYIRITRIPASGDPRDPIFKVETKYANEQTVGEHYFNSVQAMIAQLPQLAFGLTP